jgi:hypothetical protein
VGAGPIDPIDPGRATGAPRRRRPQASDTLNASVDEAGGLTIKRADDDFENQMAVAREVMMRRRRALRELAK